MNEENKSNFAMQTPEISEFQRLQERLQNSHVPVSPQQAQVTQNILELGLKKGMFSLQDILAVHDLNLKLAQGLEDHNKMVQTTQNRLLEIQESELVAKQQELAEREVAQQQKLTDERLLRKRMEDRVKTLEAQIATLGQAPISTISEVTENVAVFTPSFDKDASTTTVDKVESKPKSKAWDMVRAMNPVTEDTAKPHIDDAYDADLSHTKEPLIPLDTPQSDSRYVTENIVEEPIVEEELKVAEEDVKTTPTFSGPKITATNMPSNEETSEEESEFTIDGKPVKIYEDIEDVEKAMEEKKAALSEEVEEEYEEIVIPSESELRAMTKKDIDAQAKLLGFENVSTTQTKNEMITTFLNETEAYITQLQNDGEFISATEQEETEDSSKDDIRDGGFF